MATKDSSKTGDVAVAEPVTVPHAGAAGLAPSVELVRVELAHHWTDPTTGLNHIPGKAVWVTPAEAERLRAPGGAGKPSTEAQSERGGTGLGGTVGDTDGFVAFGDMTAAERAQYMPRGRDVPPEGGGE